MTDRNVKNQMSLRMKTLASMVTKGFSVADIGCDHGYISIYLYQEGTAPFCIASDVRKGPAEAAEKNAAFYGVQDGVAIRIGNGLETIEAGETDCILIAGMGGKTILSILADQPEKTNAAKELVLGAQSEISDVRMFLTENGFCITDEKLVFEDGKYYPFIKAVPAANVRPLLPEEILFGPVLLQKKDETLYQFLQGRIRVLTEILDGLKDRTGKRMEDRKKELNGELLLTKKALLNYE